MQPRPYQKNAARGIPRHVKKEWHRKVRPLIAQVSADLKKFPTLQEEHTAAKAVLQKQADHALTLKGEELEKFKEGALARAKRSVELAKQSFESLHHKVWTAQCAGLNIAQKLQGCTHIPLRNFPDYHILMQRLPTLGEGKGPVHRVGEA